MYDKREDGETATHLSKTEARSGSPTRMTRNILVVSLVLIAIFLGLALAMGFFETSRSGADGVNTERQQKNAVQ